MQSMNFSPREFTPSQKVNEQVLEHRCIETNVPDSRFCDNRVTTTNSNILTFVPVNILGQLSKPANSKPTLTQFISSSSVSCR